MAGAGDGCTVCTSALSWGSLVSQVPMAAVEMGFEAARDREDARRAGPLLLWIRDQSSLQAVVRRTRKDPLGIMAVVIRRWWSKWFLGDSRLLSIYPQPRNTWRDSSMRGGGKQRCWMVVKNSVH